MSVENLDIIDSTESVIMFKTIQHIETKNTTNVVIAITHEDDGEWRVTQEGILITDEFAEDKNYN